MFSFNFRFFKNYLLETLNLELVKNEILYRPVSNGEKNKHLRYVYIGDEDENVKCLRRQP